MRSPITLELDAQFILPTGYRCPVHLRLRSEKSNQCILLGSVPLEYDISQHLIGVIEGRTSDGQKLRSETAVVGNVKPSESSAHKSVEFIVDDIVLENGSFKDMIDIKMNLSESSKLVSTWVLSGSRYVSELLSDGPISFAFDGADVVFYLMRDEQLSVLEHSGHAIQQTTLMPIIRFQKKTGSVAIKACTEILELWQTLVDNISSCLAFQSQATVAWLDHSWAIIHEDGTERELKRELRFRRVSVGQAHRRLHSVDPARLRESLPNMSAAARQWGPRFHAAVDFYVSSFVLPDESRFFALTTAAEALKEAFQILENKKSLFTEKEFREIKEAIDTPLKEVLQKLEKGDLISKVSEKLNEIRRPSYKDVIDLLCKRLSVDYSDLYSEGLSFVKIRNDMIHTGKVPERKSLVAAIQKLTILLERIIGAVLAADPAK